MSCLIPKSQNDITTFFIHLFPLIYNTPHPPAICVCFLDYVCTVCILVSHALVAHNIIMGGGAKTQDRGEQIHTAGCNEGVV